MSINPGFSSGFRLAVAGIETKLVSVKSSDPAFPLSNAILCDFSALMLSSAILPFSFRADSLRRDATEAGLQS